MAPKPKRALSSGATFLKKKKMKKGSSQARFLKREQVAEKPAENPATAKHPKYDVFTREEAMDLLLRGHVRLSSHFDVIRSDIERVEIGEEKIREKVTELAKFAIEIRNQKKDVPNQLCFKEVIKCNFKVQGMSRMYYITVDAEDTNTKEVGTYQAMVMAPFTFANMEQELYDFQKAPYY